MYKGMTEGRVVIQMRKCGMPVSRFLFPSNVSNFFGELGIMTLFLDIFFLNHDI